MRKIYFLLVCALVFTAYNSNAQCSMAGRYNSYVFQNYDLTSVQYGVYNEDSMDIYEPQGDTFSLRPVIILGHGGAFVGGSRRLNAGSNTDPCVDTFCLRFARRGYVTVSIDYRMTTQAKMIAVAPFGNPDTPAAAVARAISDGKAAIRYLVKNHATYRIDTNNIFVGGNSAGAVLYMHAGYISSLSECTPLMLNALTNNGGLDGNSGNPGYTYKIKGVVNMAGGLASVGIVSAGDVPSVNCQGDQDATVPYTCNGALSGVSDTLCGLGSLEPAYNAMGIYHMSHVFTAQAHVPWDSDPGMMNTVDSLTNIFLYNLVCTVVSVNEVHTNTDVKLYPNPATELLNLSSAQPISGFTMYDQMGRTVLEANEINRTGYEINTSRLAKGIYFVRLKFTDANNAPVVRQVAIQ